MVHLLLAKPSQIIPNLPLVLQFLIVHKTPFLEKSGEGVFLFGFEKAGRNAKKMKVLDKS